MAKVASDLITTHAASKAWIRYSQIGCDQDSTPIDKVRVLDCSALVDWVYNHATGGKHLFTGRGTRSNVASIHSTIKAQKAG